VIFVYIDMGNIVLDLKCIRLMYMFETTVATLKFTFSFIKMLRLPRSLVWSTFFIKYQKSIVK